MDQQILLYLLEVITQRAPNTPRQFCCFEEYNL